MHHHHPVPRPTDSPRPSVRKRREKGQSLVEMGILLPLILVIIVGVVEVADTLNGYVTIVNAARDGARLGSKNLASDSEITSLVLVETDRLRDPVLSGDVTIQHTTFDGVNAIRVEVCNDRTLILNVPLIMPDTFRMCSETVMRVLPGQGSQSGPPPPTNTPGGNTPTATPVLPTNTPAPPTNTPVPPTNTQAPPTPTNTQAQPTPTATQPWWCRWIPWWC